MYHLVCEVNGETPNHLMFEHGQAQSLGSTDAPNVNLKHAQIVTNHKDGSCGNEKKSENSKVIVCGTLY